MARLLTEDRLSALEGYRIFVLHPDPDGAFEIAERLERAGADAVSIFDLHQLSCGLHRGVPDGAIAEISDQCQWPSVAVALLDGLAVPQVLGVTERQRRLLRPKMPNAAFIPAPMNPEDAELSMTVILRSNWPRPVRSGCSGPRHPTATSAACASKVPNPSSVGLVRNG